MSLNSEAQSHMNQTFFCRPAGNLAAGETATDVSDGRNLAFDQINDNDLSIGKERKHEQATTLILKQIFFFPFALHFKKHWGVTKAFFGAILRPPPRRIRKCPPLPPPPKGS